MIEAIEQLIAGMPMFEQLDAVQRRWLAERAELRDLPGGVERWWRTARRRGSGSWSRARSKSTAAWPASTSVASGDQPGAWVGVIPYVHENSLLTGVVTRPSRLLRVPDEAVTSMLDHGFPIAPHLLRGVTTGVERFGARVAERERLASLGRLSAGLAHELNNPAVQLPHCPHRPFPVPSTQAVMFLQ